MLAGRLHERALTIQDVWEEVGAHERGRISSGPSSTRSSARPAPAPGYCAGNFTANTMAIASTSSGSASSATG